MEHVAAVMNDVVELFDERGGDLAAQPCLGLQAARGHRTRAEHVAHGGRAGGGKGGRRPSFSLAFFVLAAVIMTLVYTCRLEADLS